MSKKEYNSLEDFVGDNADWVKRCWQAQAEAKQGKPEKLRELLAEIEADDVLSSEDVDAKVM